MLTIDTVGGEHRPSRSGPLGPPVAAVRLHGELSVGLSRMAWTEKRIGIGVERDGSPECAVLRHGLAD